MKTAFISGVAGQDGSYLAQSLLNKGYYVVGMKRPTNHFTTRIDSIINNANFKLEYGDMCDSSRLYALLKIHEPDEVYNLAAQSHVQLSFSMPEYTSNVDAIGVCNLLEACRHMCPKAKIYQASSSELFGNAAAPQNEQTPFQPVSPYSAAKAYSHYLCKIYRESYNLFISCGILFNHESPVRGESFATKKITKGIAEIKLGLRERMRLGNLDAKRDIGYAPEYVEAMHLMLSQDTPDDFVIATGRTVTIRYFLETVARIAGFKDGEIYDYIDMDPDLLRPIEVNCLQGDASKAEKILGWKPKVNVEQLAEIMYDFDLNSIKKEKGMI